LREAVRFVLVSSGESIESVLEGNFREILHSVVRERLAAEFSDADRSRQEYVTGLQERLLAPLRERLAGHVGGLFPEIQEAELAPDVPSIERTLSRVAVALGDVVTTPLDQKGTGVRGGVLVAMLSYLALNATRGMIFAVEEPEAFLHPASQEDLRDLLEDVSRVTDVTLLATTHSPYLMTRSEHGRIFCLAKTADGRTRLTQTAPGSSAHSSLIGGLIRDASLQQLLAQATELPAGAQGIVLVEGHGDELSMRHAARVVGRPDLLDDIYLRPAGGTNKMAVEATIARAATDKPVFIVLDNDDRGRETLKLLCGEKFKFQKGKQVITYAQVFPTDQRDFPYEAEDLFDPDLIQVLVDAHEPPIHEGSKRRPDGAFHYDFGQAAKGELDEYLQRETGAGHVRRWIELILLIREQLGLSLPDQTVDEIIDTASASGGDEQAALGSDVLVLANKPDYVRYQQSGAIVRNVSEFIPPTVTHVAFYVDGAIQSVVPRIVADYPGLLFATSTVEQLRTTGSQADELAAQLIEASTQLDDDLVGTAHRVILLTAADAQDTLELPAPVRNTRQRDGRPLAWAIASRVVSYASLAEQPVTTEDLDRIEAERNERSVSEGAEE
jgi:hypothetical protein